MTINDNNEAIKNIYGSCNGHEGRVRLWCWRTWTLCFLNRTVRILLRVLRACANLSSACTPAFWGSKQEKWLSAVTALKSKKLKNVISAINCPHKTLFLYEKRNLIVVNITLEMNIGIKPEEENKQHPPFYCVR